VQPTTSSQANLYKSTPFPSRFPLATSTAQKSNQLVNMKQTVRFDGDNNSLYRRRNSDSAPPNYQQLAATDSSTFTTANQFQQVNSNSGPAAQPSPLRSSPHVKSASAQSFSESRALPTAVNNNSNISVTVRAPPKSQRPILTRKATT
jgi:hypothetical protein